MRQTRTRGERPFRLARWESPSKVSVCFLCRRREHRGHRGQCRDDRRLRRPFPCSVSCGSLADNSSAKPENLTALFAVRGAGQEPGSPSHCPPRCRPSERHCSRRGPGEGVRLQGVRGMPHPIPEAAEIVASRRAASAEGRPAPVKPIAAPSSFPPAMWGFPDLSALLRSRIVRWRVGKHGCPAVE